MVNDFEFDAKADEVHAAEVKTRVQREMWEYYGTPPGVLVVAYMLCAVSGAVVGLAVGWWVWG